MIGDDTSPICKRFIGAIDLGSDGTKRERSHFNRISCCLSDPVRIDTCLNVLAPWPV
jgi:hypothetical protein